MKLTIVLASKIAKELGGRGDECKGRDHSLVLISLKLLLNFDKILVLLLQDFVVNLDVIGITDRLLNSALLNADEDNGRAEDDDGWNRTEIKNGNMIKSVKGAGSRSKYDAEGGMKRR
jgi:hypothetical protein